MSWLSISLGFDLLSIFASGAAIAAVYLILSWAVELLPLGDDRRASLARLRPLVGALLALAYSLFSVHTLFSRYPLVLPFALLLVLIAFFVGCRALIGDFFSGVALRSEQSCQVGDHVRVGETRGRITELGPRTLTLETPEGDRALVPYSQAVRLPIVRTRAVDLGASRTFVLSEPRDVPFAVLRQVIDRTALLHHWGSIARTPEVTPSGQGQIEVTAFALAEEHTSELEGAIRSAVGGLVAEPSLPNIEVK